MAHSVSSGPQFTQVWPPPEAMTLFALADATDTTKGWARWIWIPGQPMRVQNADLFDSERQPATDDPPTLRAWAQHQGWAHVSTGGVWDKKDSD